MKGRLISVEVVEDSSHLAFSLACAPRMSNVRGVRSERPCAHTATRAVAHSELRALCLLAHIHSLPRMLRREALAAPGQRAATAPQRASLLSTREIANPVASPP